MASGIGCGVGAAVWPSTGRTIQPCSSQGNENMAVQLPDGAHGPSPCPDTHLHAAHGISTGCSRGEEPQCRLSISIPRMLWVPPARASHSESQGLVQLPRAAAQMSSLPSPHSSAHDRVPAWRQHLGAGSAMLLDRAATTTVTFHQHLPGHLETPKQHTVLLLCQVGTLFFVVGLLFCALLFRIG